MSVPPADRFIVVIGASAGRLEAINTLPCGLPDDFPAPILFFMHIGASSHLAQILGRHTAPCRWPGP